MTTAETRRRLSEWFRQWQHPLRRFLAARRGIPPTDVDDIAQEVFLRIMRYDKGELVDQPQAYLFKIAANVAAEWSIRSRNRIPHESKWLDELVSGELPEALVLRSQSQREVERALRRLKPRERQVLKLYFSGGLSYADIAAHTGESQRSVRRIFIRSYQRLREELDPELLEAYEDDAPTRKESDHGQD